MEGFGKLGVVVDMKLEVCSVQLVVLQLGFCGVKAVVLEMSVTHDFVKMRFVGLKYM